MKNDTEVTTLRSSEDSYLYTLRLLGRLWKGEESYPVTYGYSWIPRSLQGRCSIDDLITRLN